jgi:hypothetical protein
MGGKRNQPPALPHLLLATLLLRKVVSSLKPMALGPTLCSYSLASLPACLLTYPSTSEGEALSRRKPEALKKGQKHKSFARVPATSPGMAPVPPACRAQDVGSGVFPWLSPTSNFIQNQPHFGIFETGHCPKACTTTRKCSKLRRESWRGAQAEEWGCLCRQGGRGRGSRAEAPGSLFWLSTRLPWNLPNTDIKAAP